jgi:predicted lysophospholipase L1 biosynthesis ABC-type transport system permease subunit
MTALALILGAVGVYGVIAQFAARRQRDWAIRVALGLSGSRVIAHILRHGALLVSSGIVLGIAGASVLTRLLSSFLYGVSAIDPIAFAVGGAALLAVGTVAALLCASSRGFAPTSQETASRAAHHFPRRDLFSFVIHTCAKSKPPLECRAAYRAPTAC